MAGDAIKIDGFGDAIAALRELPRSLRLKTLKSALRLAGRVIQGEAKAKAPVLKVRTKYRTPGLVRRSISVRASKLARKRGDVGVYVTVRRLSKTQVAAGKEAGFAAGRNPRDPFYFRFLEMGTTKMQQRPFLGPALASRGKDAVDAFSDELKRAIVIADSRR